MGFVSIKELQWRCNSVLSEGFKSGKIIIIFYLLSSSILENRVWGWGWRGRDYCDWYWDPLYTSILPVAASSARISDTASFDNSTRILRDEDAGKYHDLWLRRLAWDARWDDYKTLFELNEARQWWQLNMAWIKPLNSPTLENGFDPACLEMTCQTIESEMSFNSSAYV